MRRRHDLERTIAIGTTGSAIGAAIEQSRPDVVFNLAAAGVGKQVTRAAMVDGNAGVVGRIMDHVDPRITRMVIHAGSWSQYRVDSPEHDLTEDESMEPHSPYGAAKTGAELIGQAAAGEIGLAFITLRMFNVYGPGEGPSRLIPYVVNTTSAGSVAELTAGDQVRDFVFVDDVAAAFETCASLSEPTTRSFNVATGTGTKVRDVAVQAVEAAGCDTRLLAFGARPSREDEPSRVVGNASALTDATGWEPRTSVAEGIRLTVQSILDDEGRDG